MAPGGRLCQRQPRAGLSASNRKLQGAGDSSGDSSGGGRGSLGPRWPPASPPASPLLPPLLPARPQPSLLQLGAELLREACVAPEDPAPLQLLLEDSGGRRQPGQGGDGGDDAVGVEDSLQVAEEAPHLQAGAVEAAQDGGPGGVEVALVLADALQRPVHAGHGPVQCPQPPGPRHHRPPQPLQRGVGAAQPGEGQVLLLLLPVGKARGQRGLGGGGEPTPSPLTR